MGLVGIDEELLEVLGIEGISLLVANNLKGVLDNLLSIDKVAVADMSARIMKRLAF